MNVDSYNRHKIQRKKRLEFIELGQKEKKEITLSEGEKKNDGHGETNKVMAREKESFNRRERKRE
jgi:hypothetical protein